MSSGRFTPTLVSAPNNLAPGTGNPIYVQQQGDYQILGNICFVSLLVQISAKDPAMAGVVKIGGLPIPAASNGINTVCAISQSGLTLDSGYTEITASVNAGGTDINLVENGSGKLAQPITAGAVPSASPVIIILRVDYPI